MHQAAALAYRHADCPGRPIEVLLVTSSAGQWIIPKGDIDKGMAPHRAAEKEAFEEGGVRGRISGAAVGKFGMSKRQDGRTLAIEVDVYPLQVIEELEDWPERGFRLRRWLSPEEAAKQVGEPGLAAIIRTFQR